MKCFLCHTTLQENRAIDKVIVDDFSCLVGIRLPVKVCRGCNKQWRNVQIIPLNRKRQKLREDLIVWTSAVLSLIGAIALTLLLYYLDIFPLKNL